MDEATARALYPEAKELAGLVSEGWTISFDRKADHPELCMQDLATGEITPIAHLLPDLTYDDRRFLEKAPILLRASLFLLQQAFDEVRRLKQKERKPKDFAAECAIKCHSDGLFKRYLMEAHQLHDASDAERVKTRVRSVLAISSMAELNTDEAAAARWQKLRGDFDTWRRGR